MRGAVSYRRSAFSFVSTLSTPFSRFEQEALGKTDRIRQMKDFRNLAVWEKAHRLVLAIYKATAGFPNRREISAREPNTKISKLNSRKHCRGMWPQW
jgi:hypothetical protein